MARQRVMVAMSGGVDSSVAALLLSRAGYEVVGMTAELFGDASAAGPCCGKAGISAACTVCAHLGIEHRQVDMTDTFESQVIERFVSGYEQGITPNPCSDCNRFIKFDLFFKYADEWGCDLLATGHYARIVSGGTALRGGHPRSCGPIAADSASKSIGGDGAAATESNQETGAESGPTNQERYLAAGVDPGKDQSYFLACIAPERLRRVLFPIGELSKSEVRALATEAGLPTAQRKESQDICFMGNGTTIRELMLWHRGRTPEPGRIVDDAGRDLGMHAGVEHYTIGQRRGLKLGGGTEGLVVQKLDVASNTVVVAQRGSRPITRLTLSDFTDMAPGEWSPGEPVDLRARYRQELWQGRVHPDGNGGAVVEPNGELHLVAKGQWCVGYRDDVVLFGGIVRETDSL